jgi:alpha-ribazole phosphatase/probable phosphoglycerate mutase
MTTAVAVEHGFGPAPAGVRLRLALVRHGDADESVRGRCCGSLDPPLSNEGRRQMRHASRLLQRLAAVTIYASPQARALDSARTLEMAAPLIVDERLCEIDFGLLEGLTYSEVADRYPDVWRGWMQAPVDVAFPQGERFDVFSNRIDLAVADLTTRHPGDAIVVVAHGGVNRLILARALGLDLRHMFRLQQACGAVSLIDYYGDQAVVQVMNATWTGAASC